MSDPGEADQSHESPSIAAPTTHLAAPCITCRYDLAGLPPTGACPECNGPAGDSFAILLRRADPNYLSSIKRGARQLRLLAWLFVAYMVIAAAALVAYAMIQALGTSRQIGRIDRLIDSAAIPYTIAAWSIGIYLTWLFAAGWWRVSAELPRAPMYLQPKRRKLLRVALPIYVSLYAVTLVLGIAAQLEPMLQLVAILPTLVNWIAFVVLLFAMGPLIESLALRAPDDDAARIARSFHRFMRAAVIASVAIVPISMLGGLLLAGFGAGWPVMLLPVAAFGILALIATARYCSMCIRLERAVRSIETESEAARRE